MSNSTERTGISLPDKVRWATRYDEGGGEWERTVIEVDVNKDGFQVTLDPDGQQWAGITPEDLVWLAARLLDAHAMLAARDAS